MLSSAHRVPNARDSRRRVGVPDQARWTGRRRTGNGAHRKVSGFNKLPVVGAVTVGVEEASSAAVAGVDDEMSQPKWRLDSRGQGKSSS